MIQETSIIKVNYKVNSILVCFVFFLRADRLRICISDFFFSVSTFLATSRWR